MYNIHLSTESTNCARYILQILFIILTSVNGINVIFLLKHQISLSPMFHIQPLT
ncbi:hypothetical protein RhiirC2_851326, partial [Rhizophagus irregularis]